MFIELEILDLFERTLFKFSLKQDSDFLVKKLVILLVEAMSFSFSFY